MDISARPPLRVTSTAKAADWLREEIGAGALSGYFERAGAIVYTPQIGEEGYIEPKEEGDDNGPATVAVLLPKQLHSVVQFTYEVYKVKKDGEKDKKVRAVFPGQASGLVGNAPVHMLPSLRALRGVTHTPLVRADGTILDQPGFDTESGYVYLPERGLKMAPVPQEPTAEEVEAAVALLGYLIQDFTWKDAKHDRVNTLGYLLTPLLRLVAPPPYKLFAFGAHMPGSGKTLAALLGKIVHGGVLRASIPEKDEEFSKWALGILSNTTAPVVIADNLRGRISIPALEALLTSPTLNERKLGTNETPVVPNDRIWTVTGNNLKFQPDMLRRVVMIRIDPDRPDPQNRTDMAEQDLAGWATAHRGEILRALLILVANWTAAGKPKPVREQSDGFLAWEQTLDGILSAAGIEGQFDAHESRPEVEAEDDGGWSDLLAYLYERLGSELLAKDGFTCEEIAHRFGHIPIAMNEDDAAFDLPSAQEGERHLHVGDLDSRKLPSQLMTEANRPGGLSHRKLGTWFRNRDGQYGAGYAAVKMNQKRNRQVVWTIRKAKEDGE